MARKKTARKKSARKKAAPAVKAKRVKSASGKIRRSAHFFPDPNIDRLLTMIMNLASEISVLRERLDTHERVAASGGAVSAAGVEAYEPADDVKASRDAWRNRFLDRLLKPMKE